MEAPKLIFFLCIIVAGCDRVVSGGLDVLHRHHRHRHGHGEGARRLFVFGDSYADTGNNPVSFAGSWKPPYGVTFPGKPSGRYSDGRIFTDFFAKFMGIKTPIPYRWRKYGGRLLKFGMNFANGGTGVFDTAVPAPNMTAQIGLLEQLVGDGVFSASDLGRAVALVTITGNDYGTLLAQNDSIHGLLRFIPRVVGQAVADLKRLRRLGIGRVAVTGLQPLGCLPRSTAAVAFRYCNATENMAVGVHNLLLRRAVVKLNRRQPRLAAPSFFFVDLYDSFMSVLNAPPHRPLPYAGGFAAPILRPCCRGRSAEDSCGDVDERGAARYSVCGGPGSAFFWDSLHPTQAAWRAVSHLLRPHLLPIWS